MKKLFALIFIILVALPAGCLFDSDDDDDKNGGTAQPPETYMPFKQGSVWTFRETETDYLEDPPQTLTRTYTMTCTGQETVIGHTYWVLEDEDENETEITYIRIEGNDVYVYAPGMFDWMTTKAVPKTLQTNDELLMFRFGVSSGTTWQALSYTATEGQYSVTLSGTGKFVGLETVEVPAGTYSNCARMEMTTSITWGYGTVTQTSSSTSTMWFAPNIGPVKTKDEETAEGGTEYTTEEVLLSYTEGGTSKR